MLGIIAFWVANIYRATVFDVPAPRQVQCHLETGGTVPDEISPDLFARLANLAALELDPQESEYLRQQLNGQLKAIAELERIVVPDDVPPAAHGVPFPPAIRASLRTDQVAIDPVLAARILRQAPEGEEGYFVVPDIQHTQL